MTYRAAWVLRCHECGECATGHGPMPEHGECWICGECRRQRMDFDLDVNQGI